MACLLAGRDIVRRSGCGDITVNTNLILFFFLPGVDPKSVFCAFFKAGLCKKGDRCKFSHDPDIERKSAKRNLYADEREEEKEDAMDGWDEEKLAEVISKKHGSEKSNQTEKVSGGKKNGLVDVPEDDYPCPMLFSRYVNTSWTQSRTTSTGGSGLAPTADTTACTNTRFQRVSC